jgi:hypothetical protein
MNIVTQDPQAWEAGFKAGEQGIPGRSPYPVGSREDWSWHSGHVEGDAKRQGFKDGVDAGGSAGVDTSSALAVG